MNSRKPMLTIPITDSTRATTSSGSLRLVAAIAAPQALLWLETGVGILAGRLEDGRRMPLEGIPGVPPAWGEALLHAGDFHGLPVWLLDTPPDAMESQPAWAPAFPVWLAAAAGASNLIHSSAGSALDVGADSIEVGSLVLVARPMPYGLIEKPLWRADPVMLTGFGPLLVTAAVATALVPLGQLLARRGAVSRA